MDDPLIDEVVDRLGEASVNKATKNYVIGALIGRLDDAVDGDMIERPATDPLVVTTPKRAFLKSVTVTGFRGIGGCCELPLPPRPGLTLVVGRNGSGKSSIAEAAEFALTGDSLRWSGRTREWQKGWRNLHTSSDPEILVKLQVDGEQKPSSVQVNWESADLESTQTVVTVPGQRDHNLDSLGWSQAMKTFRPFLSYKELATIIEGRPIDRYNALAPMLGMEALRTPVEDLRLARLAAEKQKKAAEESVTGAAAMLTDSTDDRATKAADALADEWDLDKIEALVSGTDSETLSQDRVLSELEEIAFPDLERIEETAAVLSSATERMDQLRGSESEHAQKLIDLLKAAVDVHDHQGDIDCPVCGKVGSGLNSDRIVDLHEEIERLSLEARAFDETMKTLSDARLATRDAIGVVPQVLNSSIAVDVGVELSGLRAAWSAWTAAPESDLELAVHLESEWVPVTEETEAVRSVASRRRQQLADQWRPIAEKLAEMLPIAREGQRAQQRLPQLMAAERWLKRCEANIRDRRFDDVKTKVKTVWGTLAVGSNVALEDLRLGAKRIDMDVTVDGTASVALGVMSQGELHALALSLFLPRVKVSDSPFGFVMLDDPVQAMDPIRVNGLARVLDELARTHQVVVFTHDDRLPSAVRQLALPATVWSVTRRPKSRVELKVSVDPVQAALADARAVALSEELPEEARRRVIPGLCRDAIEAACLESGQKQLLARGMSHHDCDEHWAENVRLLPRIAVALYGDAGRAGEVYRTLQNKYGHIAVRTVKDCNEMTHSGAADHIDLKELIRDSERLANDLKQL